MEQAPFSDWTSRFERLSARPLASQARLKTAVTWADEMLATGALAARPESEVAQLALAQVLIIKEDALARDRALARLTRLLAAAEAVRRAYIRSKHWRYVAGPLAGR